MVWGAVKINQTCKPCLTIKIHYKVKATFKKKWENVVLRLLVGKFPFFKASIIEKTF